MLIRTFFAAAVITLSCSISTGRQIAPAPMPIAAPIAPMQIAPMTNLVNGNMIPGMSNALFAQPVIDMSQPVFPQMMGTSWIPAAPQFGPSGSLMAQAVGIQYARNHAGGSENPTHLESFSMFVVAEPEPPSFEKHDLITIIVREASQAVSEQGLETDKEYGLAGEIPYYPSAQAGIQLFLGKSELMPELEIVAEKEFLGEGEYEREDYLTGRLTAEVIEVLPNGTLVLEANTFIRNDNETMQMQLTGICRPEDVSAANTLISNQIHDLNISKTHDGEVAKSAEKGIISKVLDTIFAF
ncbi:MAG: flagellar basal body L-ring protein FlgH [Phycisphaerales bacterium]|nr:flagellar basal body L-ring protein FlgH [Phycisphaerales bacterium]